MKVGDVEIDQHYFIEEMSSHPIILEEPYITTSRMEMKVLENRLVYGLVNNKYRKHSMQFLTIRVNHA